MKASVATTEALALQRSCQHELKLISLFFSLTERFMSHADYTDYADSYIAIACMCLRDESTRHSRQAASIPCDAAFREIREIRVRIIFRDVSQH